ASSASRRTRRRAESSQPTFAATAQPAPTRAVAPSTRRRRQAAPTGRAPTAPSAVRTGAGPETPPGPCRRSEARTGSASAAAALPAPTTTGTWEHRRSPDGDTGGRPCLADQFAGQVLRL